MPPSRRIALRTRHSVWEPVTSRVLVPAEALGEAMQIIDRLEQELRAVEQRLFDTELALQLEREKRLPWWKRWLARRGQPGGG